MLIEPLDMEPDEALPIACLCFAGFVFIAEPVIDPEDIAPDDCVLVIDPLDMAPDAEPLDMVPDDIDPLVMDPDC